MRAQTSARRCVRFMRGLRLWPEFLPEWAAFLMLAPTRKRQKPCPASGFQNAEQGSLWIEIRPGLRLRFSGRCRWRGGRRRCARACILWSGKVTVDVVLADVEDHDFIWGHARRALQVELHRFAGRFVFLFDRAIVDEHGHSVFAFFLVGLI